MDIRSVLFDQLTRDEVAVWSAIQRESPHLSSPFFRPEFCEAVATVRGQVEVAVFEANGRPLGFLPFQRSRWNVGTPVGGDLSDFHGLIAPAGFECDPIELLHACRLTTWCFGNVLSEQKCFTPFVWHETKSPYIDLTDGFKAYIAQKENGGSIRARCGQKLRKLSREIGPVRFETHVSDPAIVSTLVKWKSSQYRRTGVPNVFDYSWARELPHLLLKYQSIDFSTSVSVLYAGDTVAAINFGIRSGAVLQPVIPVYNVELARYSPGLLLWLETIKAAGSLGIRRIELGKGPEPYKWRLMTGVTKVGEGVIDVQMGSAVIGRAWCTLRERVRCSPLFRLLRPPVRMARLARHRLELKVGNQEKTLQLLFSACLLGRASLPQLVSHIEKHL